MTGLAVTKRGYTTKEAAAYLGISVSTLREAARKSRIGVKRQGSTVLFDVHELDRYFDSLPSEAPAAGATE